MANLRPWSFRPATSPPTIHRISSGGTPTRARQSGPSNSRAKRGNSRNALSRRIASIHCRQSELAARRCAASARAAARRRERARHGGAYERDERAVFRENSVRILGAIQFYIRLFRRVVNVYLFG